MNNKINMKTVDGLEEGLANKADIDLSNSPYTTNRILEIPQNIKLELNSGTVTLKAGSRVYVPNGFESDGVTQKFDVYTLSSDIGQSGISSISEAYTFFVNPTKTGLSGVKTATINSGSSAPASPSFGTLWYDTTNNVIKRHNGNTWVDGFSLPFCIVSTGATSIDQVFNCFGYIGSTMFALPNIKVQGAFGVNEDGTYKLKTFTTDRVLTSLFDSNVGGNYTFGFDVVENGTITYFGAYAEEIKTSEKQPSGANFVWWNPIRGENRYVNYSGIVEDTIFCSTRLGRVNVSGGRISSMDKNPIDSIVTSNALNFSQTGRSYLSGLGAANPAKYENVTLLASGQSYRVPANGYFSISKRVTAAGQFLGFFSCGANYQWASTSDQYIRITTPLLKKGVSIGLEYNAAGDLQFFNFIYADGEV